MVYPCSPLPIGRACCSRQEFHSAKMSSRRFNALARRRSHVVAGLCVTHLVRSLDQVAQLGLRVVRGDATALVTEQILTILERHAGRAQPPTIRMFEIMAPIFRKAAKRSMRPGLAGRLREFRRWDSEPRIQPRCQFMNPSPVIADCLQFATMISMCVLRAK